MSNDPSIKIGYTQELEEEIIKLRKEVETWKKEYERMYDQYLIEAAKNCREIPDYSEIIEARKKQFAELAAKADKGVKK